MIIDAHSWIQSNKSTIGNTICKCSNCAVESPAGELTKSKPCFPQIASSNSGHKDETLKYWWIHLALGTHSHNTAIHDAIEVIKLCQKYPEFMCLKIEYTS